jgi:hypothetical protein
MDTNYIIAGLVAAFLVMLVIGTLAVAVYMKGGFSSIKFMANDSELDKLIKKINNYLSG